MIQGHDFGMSAVVIIVTTIIFWSVVVGVVLWGVQMMSKDDRHESASDDFD